MFWMQLNLQYETDSQRREEKLLILKQKHLAVSIFCSCSNFSLLGKPGSSFYLNFL